MSRGRLRTVKHSLCIGLSLAFLLLGFSPSARSAPESIELRGPRIHLKSRSFVPPAKIDPKLNAQLTANTGDEASAHAPRVHFLLQLLGPSTPETISRLRTHGIELLAPVRENGWFASISRGREIPENLVRFAGLLETADKIDPVLLDGPGPQTSDLGKGMIAVQVLFHRDVEAERIHAVLAQVVSIVERVGRGVYEVHLPRKELETLANFDAVMWIEPGRQPHPLLNDIARQATRVDEVQNAIIGPGTEILYEISGDGVQIAVFDDGVDRNHDDFRQRLIRNSGTGTHGTHVAGILGASGLLSNVTGGGSLFQFRGMAPECEIASFPICIDEDKYTEAIFSYGIEASNSSFIQSVNCDYNAAAMVLDEVVRGSAGKKVSIVYGSGNNGETSLDGSLQGYYSVFTSAKNTISVGATDSDTDVRWTQSSMGPTFDGRIKPDVVAPGCHTTSGIFSTIPADGYGFLCGTSMSSPVVTGTLALLYESYEKTLGVNVDNLPPFPSTMKAILIQTATDLVHENPAPTEPSNPDTGQPTFYHEGPDFATGYGLIDAQKAVELVQERRFREYRVHTLYTRRLRFEVPPAESELKLTIAWDDVPGNPAESNTLPKLINNLDLTLIAPDGTTHFPWVLNPPPHEPYGNGSNLTGIDPILTTDIVPATRGVDSINNVEQVVVDSPQAGQWTMRVEGTSGVSSQPFSVAANVPIHTAVLDLTCNSTTTGNRKLDMNITLSNRINLDLPIEATFTVIDCSSSENTFRTFSGKTLGSFKTVGRPASVRLPAGLPQGCDLDFRIDIRRTDLNETIASATCTFQIPE